MFNPFPKIDNYIESSKMCQKIIQWCAKIRNAPQCIENISTDVGTFPNVYYFWTRITDKHS